MAIFLPFPKIVRAPPFISEPQDYFIGMSHGEVLLADNVLIFSRKRAGDLKGKAQANSSHRRHVLCICLETTGAVYIDHQRFDLKEGEAILIPPFRFHYYDHVNSESLHWLFLTFDSESESNLLTVDPAVLRLTKQHLAELLRLSEVYQAAVAGEGPEHLLMLANAFLYGLLKKGMRREKARKGRASSWAQRIQGELAKEPALNVSQIAKRLGVSEGHLRHTFRQQQNMPLNDYVSHCRLHHAIRMLQAENHCLIEISVELGFSSQASFSRFFRRMTHTTPARFRRERLRIR